MTLSSKQNRQKIQNTERWKTRLLKEKVGNTNLYKFILWKIMTTDE